ncbi:MAG: S-adenosylmethionine:tRNA ribosyltransferase-isomerase [Candidatus Dormibacteraeota bacterium]|nr:S-adenosylmethionine:tRNA ribosyltransferase-isomerase [Candidatus Dormibacteraeota bacterium]
MTQLQERLRRADRPIELRGLARDQVRLLVVDRARGSVQHKRFDRLGEHLGPGDLLVVNSSRTLPAAVAARREGGTVVQLRPCVRRPGAWDALAVEAHPPHANLLLSPGEVLGIGDARARVVGRRPDIPLLWRLELDVEDDLEVILREGEPIRYSYVPEPVPLRHYQTVYAGRPGSAETPSAGRHFTWRLLRQLRQGGVGLAEVVLHTGLSSYQDDAFDAGHHLFEEWFEIEAGAVEAIERARRVVAVGTTVVRALETAGEGGAVRPARGWTRLAVTPERPPRVVDALLTGLHEPQASHFDLLRAFVAEDLLARAYREAVEAGYLWHEFGDAMLIL